MKSDMRLHTESPFVAKGVRELESEVVRELLGKNQSEENGVQWSTPGNENENESGECPSDL
jgi:hypothetical protein